MPDRDPSRLLHHARREAMLVLFVLTLALLWTVGYCYLRGYTHSPDSWVVQLGLAVPRTAATFDTLWGLPDWVVLGILLPWLLCSAFTMGFCLGMKEDDLGAEAGEAVRHGH